MAGHSTIGASSAKRWMNCPGSVRILATLPRLPSGEAAEKGTAAHHYAEWLLCLTPVPDKYKKYVDDEMKELIPKYVDMVLEQAEGLAKETFIEEEFNLHHLHPNLWGTNDACTVQAFGTLDVDDLKYGQGVMVEVRDNPQLMYYALGALLSKGQDVNKVRITIYQPRKAHSDGPRRSQTFTPQELIDWGNNVLGPAAHATDAKDAPLCAGDWCNSGFCDARYARYDKEGKTIFAGCPAYSDQVYDMAQIEFATPLDEITLPDIKAMTPAGLAKAYKLSSILTNWAKGLSAAVRGALDAGVDLPGLKLVMKKSSRKVLEATKLKEILGDEFTNKAVYKEQVLTLKGVGELEKQFGKKRAAELCYNPPPTVAIAASSDARPAVASSAEVDFQPAPKQEK